MMKNMITLKKNSGSQGGMKMKATPRRVEGQKSFAVPMLFFFPPTQIQMDLKACSVPEYWVQPDYIQYEPTVLIMDIVMWPEVLFCTAKFQTVGMDFFFNCLNLTSQFAFVFVVADSPVLGKGLPPAPSHCAPRMAVPTLSTALVNTLSSQRTEDLPINCPASQDSAVRVTVSQCKVLS